MRLFVPFFAATVVVFFMPIDSQAMSPTELKLVGPTTIVGQPSPAKTKVLRLFISGHSLTDQPMPDFLDAIASSLNTPLQWNRQYVVGSSIAARTKGKNQGEGTWAGYRSGFNRTGEGLDVLAELRKPQTVSDGAYDALLITEQHGLLGSLTWHDTTRYLRHFHERLIEGSPQAKTYFYESWLSLNDKSDPRRWIAYERAASPIWQCIATRVNVSLQAEGRADRIASVPVGAAMAHLVERAIEPAGLPGISLGTTRQTVDSIIADDVHPTPLGSYYSALVSYAVLFGRTPVGAWHPQAVSEKQAIALQKVAGDFVNHYASTNVPLTLDNCQETLRSTFISTYWGYVRDTYWRREGNALSAYFQWAKSVLQWQWRMRKNTRDNPFYFEPQTDHTYWLPAP